MHNLADVCVSLCWPIISVVQTDTQACWILLLLVSLCKLSLWLTKAPTMLTILKTVNTSDTSPALYFLWLTILNHLFFSLNTHWLDTSGQHIPKWYPHTLTWAWIPDTHSWCEILTEHTANILRLQHDTHSKLIDGPPQMTGWSYIEFVDESHLNHTRFDYFMTTWIPPSTCDLTSWDDTQLHFINRLSFLMSQCYSPHEAHINRHTLWFD